MLVFSVCVVIGRRYPQYRCYTCSYLTLVVNDSVLFCSLKSSYPSMYGVVFVCYDMCALEITVAM